MADQYKAVFHSPLGRLEWETSRAMSRAEVQQHIANQQANQRKHNNGATHGYFTLKKVHRNPIR